MYNPLLAVSVQLSDAKEGDGGYVVIRGSHKARFWFLLSAAPGQSLVQDSALRPRGPRYDASRAAAPRPCTKPARGSIVAS